MLQKFNAAHLQQLAVSPQQDPIFTGACRSLCKKQCVSGNGVFGILGKGSPLSEELGLGLGQRVLRMRPEVLSAREALSK